MKRPAHRAHPIRLAAILLLLAVIVFSHANYALGRAGGGGSSSGGSSGGSSSSRSRSGDSGGSVWGFIIFVLIFIPIVIIASKRAREAAKLEKLRLAELQKRVQELAGRDPSWNHDALMTRTKEVFLAFQKAWSEFDFPTMKAILTDEYYRRMVLELTVLAAMKRKNGMESVQVTYATITSIERAEGADGDGVTILFNASAFDTLLDLETNTTLSASNKAFSEYWIFKKEGGAWKLDRIRQTTEAAWFVETPVSEFAKRNGFCFDPDFGWLMMPNKGAIFGATKFERSDINNHVIGYYRSKVVEFYTYRPDPNDSKTPNYLIAQVVLPTAYKDIWVRKKTWMDSCPKGLTEMSLEYPDFNKKFTVCAHPEDRISSLELLTPNFMTKIYDLPFELNIEVVGNFLYFYTKKRDVSYDRMLEILSWAFDEMKF